MNTINNKMITKRTEQDCVLYTKNNTYIECPHGPAVRYDNGINLYQISNKVQNIVGPAVTGNQKPRVFRTSKNPKVYWVNDIHIG